MVLMPMYNRNFMANVRYWHKADMLLIVRNVRFWG
jgi:hypothetical protein